MCPLKTFVGGRDARRAAEDSTGLVNVDIARVDESDREVVSEGVQGDVEGRSGWAEYSSFAVSPLLRPLYML